MSGLWRYRVGDYRILLCQTKDCELLVLVVAVAPAFVKYAHPDRID